VTDNNLRAGLESKNLVEIIKGTDLIPVQDLACHTQKFRLEVAKTEIILHGLSQKIKRGLP
tara:strand:+ start:1010 stop:1192 length:183 start_codon:yes stop_codon:yes gene_type:complete